jgi:L-ascorbate metabolism protein UlaG (beta-lactamase superfamily)
MSESNDTHGNGNGAGLRVRRLGWAGVEVANGDDYLVIDAFLDNAPLEPFTGPLHAPVLPPSRPGEACAALVTHLHSDHADPAAIADAIAPGAPVLRPAKAPGEGLDTIAQAAAEGGFAERGLATEELEPWESREIGPFTVTALPAVDGFGDPQVSWAVEAGGKRIVHMGDTLFHGFWWVITMRVGAIDLALLPVNGAFVSLPHRQPASPFVAVMDPGQAAAAAQLMGAPRAMPIHYDAIHKPPTYVQTHDPAGSFVAEARKVGVEAVVIDAGEEIDVA